MGGGGGVTKSGCKPNSTIVETLSSEEPMGAQLNIKSEDAYRLASELAGLTGESLTTAVTRALSERLQRERKAHDREERLH